MARHQIVGIGEILWDVLPTGPQFGGAPANFACSCAGLARELATVSMISSVGDDELGRRAIDSLQARDVCTEFVTVQRKQTGRVDVELDETGSASYVFASDTAWDNLAWSTELASLATNVDAVCFGTLGQRNQVSKGTIRQFVAATKSSALRIFDINIRRPFISNSVILESLQIANVLKLNEDELPVIQELLKLHGSEVECLQHISQQYKLKLAALTKGAAGSILVQGDEVSDQPSRKVDVGDTVGAGDAFTAMMALGMLENRPLDDLHSRASKVAAYVCTQNGGTPDLTNAAI